MRGGCYDSEGLSLEDATYRRLYLRALRDMRRVRGGAHARAAGGACSRLPARAVLPSGAAASWFSEETGRVSCCGDHCVGRADSPAAGVEGRCRLEIRRRLAHTVTVPPVASAVGGEAPLGRLCFCVDL